MPKAKRRKSNPDPIQHCVFGQCNITQYKCDLYDICMCKDNYGPRKVPLLSCRPAPDNIEALLQDPTVDILPPYCNYFTKRQSTDRRGGRGKPVLV